MKIPHELLEPWAIQADSFRQLLDFVSKPSAHDSRPSAPSALLAHDGVPLDGARNVELQGDVALIHVKGILGRYKSWYIDTSYGHLRKDLQRVLDESSIAAIAWIFDSPGGEVNGCAELADAIYAARGKKPMKGYAGGLCASACYFLASAVGDLECAPTAVLGSVGVMTTLVDWSKMLEDVGIKEYEIVSTQSPKKAQQPGDSEYRARVQQRLDDLADVFIARVAQYRAVTPAMVMKKYGQGDVMVGARAVDAGLADGISDFETVLAGLSGRRNANPYQIGAKQMELKTYARLVGLEESATERQVEDRTHALAGLERDIIKATGAKSGDEAVGIAKAGVEAITELNTFKLEREREQAALVQSQFRAAVKAAIDGGKLSLGEAASFLPTMLNEKAAEKVVVALAGVKEQTADAIVAALAAGEVSAKALVRVQAYLGAKGPAMPAAPPPEPAPTEQQRVAQLQVTAAAAAEYGLTPEDVARYSNIKNADDLLKKKGAK